MLLLVGDDLEKLRNVVNGLVERVANIERRLELQAPARELRNQNIDAPKLKVTAPVSVAAPAPPAEPIGGKLLGAAAVICFLLAASFVVRQAFISGWLTPGRALFLVALAGAGFIVAGFTLKRRDAPYAAILPGTGLVILWMCAYAGNLGLEIYGSDTASVFVLLLCGLSYFLFRKLEQQFFLLTLVLGAYTMPFLLPMQFGSSLQKFQYIFIWDVLFSAMAIMLRSRRMIALAAYLALLCSLFAAGHEPRAEMDAIVFQVLQFAVFFGATIRYSMRHRAPLTSGEAWAFFPALMFFYAIEYFFLHEVAPSSAPWIAFLFAIALAAAQRFAEKALGNNPLASRPVVSSVVSIILMHLLYLDTFPASLRAWIGLGLLVLVPQLKKSAFNFERFGVAVWIGGAVALIEYLNVLIEPGRTGLGQYAFLLNGLFGGILLFGYFNRETKDDSIRKLILLAASAQSIAALTRLADFISSGPTSDYLSSALFGSYALGLMMGAKLRRDSVLARVSLVIFLGVSYKVIFLDMAESGVMVRALGLLVVGGLLYAGGLVSRQLDRELKANQPANNSAQ